MFLLVVCFLVYCSKPLTSVKTITTRHPFLSFTFTYNTLTFIYTTFNPNTSHQTNNCRKYLINKRDYWIFYSNFNFENGFLFLFTLIILILPYPRNPLDIIKKITSKYTSNIKKMKYFIRIFFDLNLINAFRSLTAFITKKIV